MFITLVVPVRLAFAEDDPTSWLIVYAWVDISFFIDIIITFLTSYTDETTNLEVTDFGKIARNYIKSWFIFDALSIVPLDYFVSVGGTSNFNSIFRFAKFGKVYKLVRLTRLIKFIKLLKKNGGIIQ